MEQRKGGGFFAGAEETRRDAELVVYGHGDATFARAIQLGDDEAVERAGFMEFLGLVEGVGTGGGIDDKQREVGRGWVLFGEGAADFAKFFHQVVAGVDASGGVADEKITAAGDGLLMGMITH